MSKSIRDLAPQEVWAYFAAICAIPHPSHHEQAIHDYLVAEAKTLGLACIADDAGNVLIRKGATPGLESCKGIVLQGHMDMVPQKNSDKAFDFTKDPIEPHIDGDWVKARGTTLGADNGLGLAAALAVMASKTLKHGPLELLVTASEETGMNGAFGLKPGLLQGEILLNLDTEQEGELCVGCAGGEDVNVTLPYREEAVPAGSKAFRLELRGLLGGHSGMEIHLERGNANKIMNRFLLNAATEFSLRLASIDGGGLRNAIPRESTVTVVVPEGRAAGFVQAVGAYETLVRAEFKGVDDGLSFKAYETVLPASRIDAGSQEGLLKSVAACPNGIVQMSPSIPGLVQTSTNLARVVSDGKKVFIQCLMRSSVDSEKKALGEVMQAVFSLAGAQVELSGGYNGWNPNPDSAILATMLQGYKALFGKKAHVSAIHAGLECGILGGTYPGLDMISFGPTIRFPHSPDEQLEIASVGKFWDYLCYTLANAPKK